MARAGAVQDPLEFGSIAETHSCSRSIDGELLRQVACDLLFVGEQQLFEFADVVELSAVRKFAASIHRERVMKGKFLAAFGDARFRLAFADRAIMVPPAAEHIEILERK